MDVKEKDLEKLDKLDRIEYRQRVNNIKHKYSTFRIIITGISLITFLLASSLFINDLMVYSNYENIGAEFFDGQLEIMQSMGQLVDVVTFLMVVFLVVTLAIKYSKINKLNKEYFDVSIKSKSQKKK